MRLKNFLKQSACVIAILSLLFLTFVNISFAGEKITLKVAHVNAKTHPVGIGLEFFKEKVKTLSEGRINAKVFHSAALGGAGDTIQGCQLGNIEMGTTTCGAVIPFCPEFDIMSLPFIFKDAIDLYKMMKGDLGKALGAALEKKVNIMAVGFSSGGTRQVECRVPIHKVDDLKGLKIRTMNDPGIIEVFKLFGAIPTPISFGEVYTALQSGVVDGCETSFISWINSKLNEVAKYGIRINYMDTGRVFFASKKFINKLSPEDREIILSTMKKAVEVIQNQYVTQEAGIDDKARKLGATIIYPDLDSFKKAAAPIYEKFKPTLGKEWLDKIRGTS